MSMQLSSWAIRRPIPTIVLFLVLAIAGWTSFLGLPINANPRVDFPVVTVAVPQVGAAPTELEHAVTLRVERAVSGLAGIRHITSTVADGISITTVEFQLGIDPAGPPMTSAMPSRRSAPTCPRRSRNPSSPASISRAAPS